MKKKLLALTIALTLLFVTAIPAFAAGPNFGEAIYADDAAWGTKGTADLPAPNDHNQQSFDGLYKFQVPEEGKEGLPPVNGQLAVAEAAPGNPAYNGGRWIEIFVVWSDGSTPVLVTSFAQLEDLIDSGDVIFLGETGNYFQCPLLPVK